MDDNTRREVRRYIRLGLIGAIAWYILGPIGGLIVALIYLLKLTD